MRVTAVSVAVHDAATDRLVFRVAAGPEGGGVVGLEIAAHEGIAGYVFSTGQPLAVADVVADPRFERTTAERTGYVPRSLLAVPLVDEEGTLGVMELLDRRDGVAVRSRRSRDGRAIRRGADRVDPGDPARSRCGRPLQRDARRVRDRPIRDRARRTSMGPRSMSSSRPSQIGSTRTTRCGDWPTGSAASARLLPEDVDLAIDWLDALIAHQRRRETAGR